MQELTAISLPARLAVLLDAKNGGNQSELARHAGVSPQAVQQWVAGKTAPRGNHLAKVADYLGVTRSFLLYGEQSAAGAREQPADYAPALHEGPQLGGRVPLISWLQAGDFASAVDNLHPGDAEEWAETTVPIHRHTYALRVNGDSMTNPAGEPSFPHDSIIVVE